MSVETLSYPQESRQTTYTVPAFEAQHQAQQAAPEIVPRYQPETIQPSPEVLSAEQHFTAETEDAAQWVDKLAQEPTFTPEKPEIDPVADRASIQSFGETLVQYRPLLNTSQN